MRQDNYKVSLGQYSNTSGASSKGDLGPNLKGFLIGRSWDSWRNDVMLVTCVCVCVYEVVHSFNAMICAMFSELTYLCEVGVLAVLCLKASLALENLL